MRASKWVWIVEVSYPEQPDWHPTVGIALTRYDAVQVIRDWRKRNPNDNFCLTRYERRPTR